MNKKIHLSTDRGGRSTCRYSSRYDRRITIVPKEEFIKFPVCNRCSECDSYTRKDQEQLNRLIQSVREINNKEQS